jgi:hypothetical protein
VSRSIFTFPLKKRGYFLLPQGVKIRRNRDASLQKTDPRWNGLRRSRPFFHGIGKDKGEFGPVRSLAAAWSGLEEIKKGPETSYAE